MLPGLVACVTLGPGERCIGAGLNPWVPFAPSASDYPVAWVDFVGIQIHPAADAGKGGLLPGHGTDERLKMAG